MSIAGFWNLKIATPLGAQAVTLVITERAGVIEGVAQGAAETVPMVNPTLSGNQLTWSQSITKPMRLNLAFDVTIDGDTLTGVSKAGRLPTSRVTGVRAATSDPETNTVGKDGELA